ncbi:DUF3164 family protein [Acinetobacter soli]|uniref:DUF3164 family protein n=1 Tax=Acinetobacter soli TaxID=487316 RepID=UPI002090D69C|nr:DUF3164 family protein [Acinetobacter soli]WEH92951.1 DUF3164 family protein [Acinetobacter soli]WEI01572.1 DUF3164 family protein [Acinetobacter soli]
MELFYSIQELVDLQSNIQNPQYPNNRQGFEYRAKKEKWEFIEEKSIGRNGFKKKFRVPLELALDIQNYLKPQNNMIAVNASKHEVAVATVEATSLMNWQREVAENRLIIVRYLQKQIDNGMKKTPAIEIFIEQAVEGVLPAELQEAVSKANAKSDVAVGGAKGNLTLFSFDGKYKIVRQIQDSIRFDERLQAAKALIDECIQSWSANSNDYLKVLVNDAFQVDKEGKISTGRVLGLRRHNIDDTKWQKAMQAISDSIIVTDSKNYVRFYERDEDGKYQPISLDFANI